MINKNDHKISLDEAGFSIIENIYTDDEVKALLLVVDSISAVGPAFRKSGDLFAIRRFLKEIPKAKALIFNAGLMTLINQLFGPDFFVVKSIYFDKPQSSNWFVPYHQDLTISVDKKQDLENYGPWTVKQDQFAVQPPLEILKSIYTIRIHLDDTDENNGALLSLALIQTFAGLKRLTDQKKMK